MWLSIGIFVALVVMMIIEYKMKGDDSDRR